MISNPDRAGDGPAVLPSSPRDPLAGKTLIGAGTGELNWTAITCALLALAVWVLCHPYRGIVHDNRIYALLALNYSDPTTFARDLFLEHGSQDSFTFFSPLYAWAIGLLGMDWSSKLLVASGQVLWVLCALQLIRSIVAPRFTWLALLFLAAYPPYYGGYSIFSLAEGFLTPRIFAEAMGLAAIAAFLNGRSWLAALLLAIGGLLHPLMMIAPAGVIATMAVLRHRPWWWTVLFVAGFSTLVVLVVAFVHIAGLPILPKIDPQWKFVVDHRTGQLLVANWDGSNWLSIAADVIIVLAACFTATPQVRQILLTALAIGLASLAGSFIGFDLLDDLTIGKAQVWRALWLLHALAPVALALVIQDVSSRDVPERKLVVTLAFSFAVTAWLCFETSLPPFGISIAFLLALVHASVVTEGAYTRSRSRDVTVISIGFGVLVLMFIGVMISAARSGAIELDSSFFQSLLVAFIILLAGVLLLTEFMIGRRQFLAVAAFAMLCLFLFRWDGRSEWRRYMDSTPDIASEIPISIAPGEVVYWPTDVMALWGALRRPSFYSEVQGAGAIFNRGTALGFRRRLELVSRFEPNSRAIAELLGRKAPAALVDMEGKAELDDLVELCSNADHPDVVVLAQDIAGAMGKPWKPRVPYSRVYVNSSDTGNVKPENIVTKEIDEYFFYRCRDITQAVQHDARNGHATAG